MKLVSALLASLLGVFCATAAAQTSVIARPDSDEQGWAVFEVIKVLRIEGTWENAPEVGQRFYPRVPVKAYPISRFGEAVVIELPEPGNMSNWKGIHVHNGYIPALNGLAAKTLIKQIENRPQPVMAANTRVARHTPQHTWTLRECPVCHRIHIRM